MDNSFDNILFLTSFCCMACDGEIVPEEIKQLKSFSEKENLFVSLDINEEFNRCLDILKEIGNDFLKSYFEAIEQVKFSDNEKLNILDVAVKTILADNKVEYNEIKFFKHLFTSLNIDKQVVLSSVPNIEDYWLEEDFSSRESEYSYFDKVEISLESLENLDIH